MKKSIFFAAVAALFALASCQVDIIPVEEIAVDPVFTADIITTRTTIELVDAANAKVSWVIGDEVTITDGTKTNNVLYAVSAVDSENGQATLTKKDGETGTLGAGPYTAVYGEAPSTSQTHTGNIPSLPMSSNEITDAGETLNFTVSCGVLEFYLQAAEQSIKYIGVSDERTYYVLTCTTPIDISSGATFYLALPAGNYTTFTFTNASGVNCTKTIKSGSTFTISANSIQAIRFTSLSFAAKESYPTGTLDGVFSVAVNKKVRFSQGNLQYQASSNTWKFATNQYDIIGNAAGNTTISGRHNQSDWIDLFGWGATGKNSFAGGGHPYSTSGTYQVQETADPSEILSIRNNGDWGVCMGTGWRTLSKEEWEYLIGHARRQLSTVTFAPDLDVFGLIIMPDGFTDKLYSTIDQTTWQTLESKGAVFLPHSGFRNETTINSINDGYYWTSSAAADDTSKAYDLYLKNVVGESPKLTTLSRSYGMSVRLVIDN